jgi:Terpene synthase family 2, C-terminal metal binding
MTKTLQKIPSATANWYSEIVIQNKPQKNGSPCQAWRFDQLPRIMGDLTGWADQYQLPPKRIQSGAYTGIVAVRPENPGAYELAVLLGKFTLWIFVFDGLIDKLVYHQAGSAKKLAYLDSYINHVVSPLYERGLTTQEARETGLGYFEPTSAQTQIGCLLREAWVEMYQDFEKQLKRYKPENLAFSLKSLVLWTAKMIGAMRWELCQKFHFAQTGDPRQLPSLHEYLEHGKYSIAVGALGTLAAGFEDRAAATWEASVRFIDAGAKVARLANDLGNYWAELIEKKINSVSISLRELGYNPLGDYEVASAEVKRAKAVIKAKLAEESDLFISQLKLDSKPLNCYVKNAVAFTLTMYETDNYVTPQ